MNGDVLVNGQNAQGMYSGGGSAGSIYVVTRRLDGSGIIQVNKRLNSYIDIVVIFPANLQYYLSVSSNSTYVCFCKKIGPITFISAIKSM